MFKIEPIAQLSVLQLAERDHVGYSYLSTLRKQSIPLLTTLEQALVGHPVSPASWPTRIVTLSR